MITLDQVKQVFEHCEHCADGKSVDGQIVLCGNRGLFSMLFCPFCGAPLTDEAVQMMIERMAALKDGTME